jgi:hypothetical protein
MPQFPTATPVRMTAAAIMREDAVRPLSWLLARLLIRVVTDVWICAVVQEEDGAGSDSDPRV